jgi:glyoxylase-like metal-dependent hydrolase (beta-lactamase superfamily II)
MSKPVFEEVLPQLFRAEIPLPKNPLKTINSYIIKDKERNLVIDTGMNLEECHTAMMEALGELQIDLHRTDFYITHMHVDHLGLVGRLALPSSRIYFNHPDAEIVALNNVWEFLFQAAARHGFPHKELTPNISAWDDTDNSLQVYLQSLDKVYRMELDLILPGHRSIVSDCRGRILELKKHHEERLQEVLSIIKSAGAGSAYEVAAQMEWDIDARDWEEFPLTQKWFATGEAVAHLRYLEETGAARRKERNGTIIFQISS